MSYYLHQDKQADPSQIWEVRLDTKSGYARLGCFPSSQEAVDRIHYLNGGEKSKPTIVHCTDPESYKLGYDQCLEDIKENDRD